jgi:dienelactone hydrolase
MAIHTVVTTLLHREVTTVLHRILTSQTALSADRREGTFKDLPLATKRALFTLFVMTGALLFATQTANAQVAMRFDSAIGTTSIPATLWKPEGDGPFPAVVIMHDCSGLGRFSSGSPARWSRELVALGYVTLLPDSFTPRGLAQGVCTFTDQKTQAAVNAEVRVSDAIGALDALRKLTYVDKTRIGIMGGSHGGWATLAAMAESGGPLAEAKRKGFAAGLALYPSCLVRYGEWVTRRKNGRVGPMTGFSGHYQALAPVLILTGEEDDWTPAEPCRAMVESSRARGQNIDIRIYSGAHHAFDSSSPLRFDPNRNNPAADSGLGATTAGHREAWAAARREVAEFFSIHLGQRRVFHDEGKPTVENADASGLDIGLNQRFPRQ